MKLILSLLLTSPFFCTQQIIPPKHLGEWQTIAITTNYQEKSFTVPVLIYFPKISSIPKEGYPLMIALHGWNLKMKEWQDESGISTLADKYGILIVCPEMGQAFYEKEYFPETTMKWQPKPSALWIYEDLYQTLKNKYPVTTDRLGTGVMGVSTGGHGALLLAEYYPEIFGFASSISGDFDLPKMPNDKLSLSIYGPYETFPERWLRGSSTSMIDKLKQTKIYLAHGTIDHIVPVSQTRIMAATLKNNSIEYLYNENKTAKHDWHYWQTEIAPTIEYFIKK